MNVAQRLGAGMVALFLTNVFLGLPQVRIKGEALVLWCLWVAVGVGLLV